MFAVSRLVPTLGVDESVLSRQTHSYSLLSLDVSLIVTQRVVFLFPPLYAVSV